MEKAPVKLRLAVPYNNRLQGLPNQNLITLLESLWTTEDPHISVVRLPEEALIGSDDYDAVFTTRDVGAQDEHLEWYKKQNIYLLAWHDDLHRYRWTSDEKVRMLFRKFEYADLIFCPYTRTLHGEKVYRPFLQKVVNLPWSIADWVLDINTEWDQRKDKILLSGMIARQYPFRKKIKRHANRNKKLFDVLEHPTYRAGHLEHSIIGQEYYQLLSRYKGGIVTTARRPINYTVAKYVEVPACRCISFMEKTPDLQDMGYIDGENYISINRWNFRKKTRIIYSDEAKEISILGKELVRKYHTHTIRIRSIFEEFKKLLGIEE